VSGATLEEALLRMTAMTPAPQADDAFVACVDLLEQGVTTVQLMFHTFGDPDDYREALDATIRGIRMSGIRAVVILGTTDQAEFLPVGSTGFDLPEFSRVQRRLSVSEFGEVVYSARSEHPDIAFGIGPVGPQWCSDSLLGAIGDIVSEGLRVHTHFLESAAQRSWAPGNLLFRLQTHGLLGPHTSLAHAVWCTDTELELLADFGVQLVTCPHSNRLLNAGRAPVNEWLRHGITVGIGLDSADPHMKPLDVARLALSPQDADRALCEGGLQCAGFADADDVVMWTNRDSGLVKSVDVDGVRLVTDGQFHDHSEVDSARARIQEHMDRDAPNRRDRHNTIDAMIERYRHHIAEVRSES
jgi:cytosine/adenosine deaminase-related metal-dependent hydrolase